MRLRSADGSRLDLTIQDYEFPSIDNDPEDSNWLVAAIQVQTPRGSWKAVGIPFQADELVPLADWLHAISVGGEFDKEHDFYVPLLSLECPERKDGLVLLKVGFGLEYVPPWAERDEVGPEQNAFEFRLTADELETASLAIRADAQRFPVRGYR